MKRGTEVAMDTVKLSHQLENLKTRPDDALVSQTTHETLQVAHVLNLLSTVHRVVQNYDLTAHNCWLVDFVRLGLLFNVSLV